MFVWHEAAKMIWPLNSLTCKLGVQSLEQFLTKARLGVYEKQRNDPNADAISGLSGYIHFGQLAAARCALEAGKHKNDSKVRRACLHDVLDSANASIEAVLRFRAYVFL